MTLLAVCGDAATTTAFALASTWPTPDVLLVEADASGGDLAAWLDIPEQPGKRQTSSGNNIRCMRHNRPSFI